MRSKPIQGFLPWILYFVISGSQYLSDEIAALSGLAAVIVFNLKNLRKKFLLDWATLVYFAFLSVMYWLPVGIWLNQYSYILSNVALAAIMWVSIFVKKPFTMQYAREEVDEFTEKTPIFKQINYAISSVWALALSLTAVDGFLESINIIPSSFVTDSILVLLIIIAIWFTEWFPDWYQGFLFRKFSKKKEDTTKNPYLQGNFAPVKDELFVDTLPIEGELPQDLLGIYMRNGPNPAFEPISYTYPLDGDGMLHAIYIHDGKANYRNRFVDTKGLIAEKKQAEPYMVVLPALFLLTLNLLVKKVIQAL